MDDLDDLLRAAMKTLDDQVPSGYFEDLPARTLARLEESMQTQPMGSEQSDPKMPVQQREENSGLHDIRSLAHSTKARLSKKITAAHAPVDDIAATSGAWKHVALPEPAKMVALPSLDELPSAQAVLEAAKQHEAASAAVTSASAGTATAKPAFTAWADKPTKKSKAPLFATLGVGLAAAAGAVLYLNHGGAKKETPDTVASAPAAQPAAERSKATVEPINENGAPAPQAPPATTAPAGGDGVAGGAAMAIAAPADKKEADKAQGQATDETTRGDSDTKNLGKLGTGGVTKGGKKDVSKDVQKTNVDTGTSTTGKSGDKNKVDTTKTETKKGDPKKGGTGEKKGGDGEPNLDDLLNEAGMGGKEQKQPDKPKLDKTSLSGDDFKKGMSAVAGKAAGCYKGTQGTAQVKLTIAPSGQVSKVAVSGQFAGTPEGACIEAAVRSASFPPWDGGPQSFGYPILLSE